MNKTIKNLKFKYYISVSFALIILCIFIFIITRLDILKILTGPVIIDSHNLNNFNGCYTSFDLSDEEFIPIDYYEYDERTISYIVYNKKYNFYIGVCVPNDYEDDVDNVISYANASPQNGTKNGSCSFHIKGTLNKMISESKNNFEFSISFLIHDDEFKSKISDCYVIEYDTIDNMDITYIIYISCLGVFLLFIGIFLIIKAFTANGNKEIDEFLQTHSQFSLDTLNELFDSCKTLSNRIFANEKITFIVTSSKLHIILHEDVKSTNDSLRKITLMNKLTYHFDNDKKDVVELKKKEIIKLNSLYKDNNLNF